MSKPHGKSERKTSAKQKTDQLNDYTRDRLEEYLFQQTNHQAKIEAIERPTANGFSADTFLIKLQNASLPPRIVVQAAPTKGGLFEHYDIKRSYRVQQALASFKVPVAKVHYFCPDKDWIGAPFYIMDHVPGRVPSDRPPYHEAGWFSECTPEARDQIWHSGIKAMAALHSVDSTNFDFLSHANVNKPPDAINNSQDDAQLGAINNSTNPSDCADQRIEEWYTFGEALGVNAETTLLRALASLRDTRPISHDLQVHWGDAKLGNMIFDNGEVAAILDWELCGLSVGEEDLAHWLAVDWYLSTGRGIKRLDGLPNITSTLATYESAVGRKTNNVAWWFAFALVRMGLIFQRAAVQASHRRARPVPPNIITPFAEPLIDGSLWSNLETLK